MPIIIQKNSAIFNFYVKKISEMKKCFLLTLLPLLCGCFVEDEPEEVYIINDDQPVNHNYYEVSSYEISWQRIFDVPKETYYVYCYQLTCSHCEELKDYIIVKALELKNIYFVRSSAAVILSSDISGTIGAQNVSQLSILGYPSLLEISNKRVTKNLAGKSPIKALLG